LMQSTTNIGLLVGPAVGGIGIALMGAQNVLYLDAATFLLSALCLMPIRMHETLGHAASTSKSKGWTDGVAQDLLAGFRFVFVEQKSVLLLMVLTTLYSVGISAFVVLLPVFAKDVLALGNITGAMVFQATFPVAIGLLFTPWRLDVPAGVAAGIALVAATILLVTVRVRGGLNAKLLLLQGALYVAYVVFVFARA